MCLLCMHGENVNLTLINTAIIIIQLNTLIGQPKKSIPTTDNEAYGVLRGGGGGGGGGGGLEEEEEEEEEEEVSQSTELRRTMLPTLQ